jgi:hypothetical protein
MEFENGGQFSKAVHGHTYFRVLDSYSWLFSGVEQELERLGYSIGYESGYIGQDNANKPLRMSIEIFVGEEDAEGLVEASFDLTIEETEAGRGRLGFGPMTGPVEVPGLDYRTEKFFEVIAGEPNNALIATVANAINEMSRRMIPAYRDAFK